MPKINLKITLTLQGPILTQSSSPGEYGLDAAMARKADGKPYLPGTLILGRLRQAWQELSEATQGAFISTTEINILFGSGSGGNRQNPSHSVQPLRKVMQATDFVASTVGNKNKLFRIRMDKARGSVETGAYLVIDSPFAPGEKVTFTGTVSYFVTDDKDEIRDKIEKGLQWIPSFGAERTVGFGRLLKVEIDSVEGTTRGSENLDGCKTSFRLRIKPHDAFCIARRQVDQNLFESEEIIPGSVIKGGLASTWGMLLTGKGASEEIMGGFDDTRKELAEEFEHIRFTHAFPLKNGGKRPVVAPYSLVRDQDESILEDAATWPKPKLLTNASPKFANDWKKAADVRSRFGWPTLHRELRVRTAMDRLSRKSKDQQLFAYEMVVPNGHEWEGGVDLSRVKDSNREKVLSQFVDLLGHGLNACGKTKTSADTWIAGVSNITTSPPLEEKYYIVTLQTPALLCNPEDLNEISGDKALFNKYEAVWNELAKGSMKLVQDRYFASQSLAGGFYLHKRFQTEKSYYPWLLTDAGSVFVLEVVNAKEAETKINDWLQHGLELPAWAIDRYKRGDLPGNHWKCCPYIPENGFGEIAVNINLENFHEVTKEGENG